MKELKKLPRDIQEKWKANYIKLHGNNNFYELFSEKSSLSTIINSGFTWSETSEGGNYWINIYNNLDKYKTIIWI